TDEKAKAEDGITLFIVDAKSPGISTTVLNTIANDELCEVVFNQVKVPGENILGELNRGWSEVQKIVERAAVAKCCEMLGGMQSVLEMTVDYAKERKQFDRPIGSFQTIQHYCVDMLTDIESAMLSTYKAAWMINEGLPCREQAAIAKAWATQASERILAPAHQIHGAIGVTMDHDLHYYTRRLKAAAVAFGGASRYQEIVSQEMGL
ncbi:acyl-CoA dehydrogenase family protein, partial [Chloroflexota bacterium]